MNEKDVADIRQKYQKLTRYLIEHKLQISTMESCTSGQIASMITDTEGASAVLKGAFVTYCNEAKILQGVPADTIEKYGVYSVETAIAMARACMKTYSSNIGIGVTGTMGNIDENNQDSIPGHLYYAICYEGTVRSYHRVLTARESRLYYKMSAANLIVDSLFNIMLGIDAD